MFSFNLFEQCFTDTQCPEVMTIRRANEGALIKIIKDLFIGVRWENV